MHFQVKFDVRAVFWRRDSLWYGEALEVDASVAATGLQDAISKLLSQATRASQSELRGGLIPGRQPPNALLARWDEINQRGGQHHLKDLFTSDCSEVATTLTVHLRDHIEERHQLEPLHVQVLLVKDAEAWISQCLEYDLGGQGSTREEAMREALRAIDAQVTLDRILGKPPLQDLPKAPAKFWEIYRDGAAIEPPFGHSNELDPIFRVAS